MTLFSIRSLQAGDADSLLQFELANRSWFERYIEPRGDAFYTADGVREHIAQYLRAQANGTLDPSLMFDGDGAIVGRANLKDIHGDAGCAEVGYRLAQQQTGRGLATHALRHLMQIAHSRWQLRQLVAYVTVDNPASARVLEKSGFLRRESIAHLTTIQGRPLAGYGFVRPVQ